MRIADFLDAQYGIKISKATLVNIVKEAESSPFPDLLEDAARESFKGSTVFHSDETGVSVRGENNWVHVIVNVVFTLFFAHKKRGM
ncbi:MAG: transposase [Deltaproteobacteria bacterium]|nr:transposase [Deltaproteobacteria bacterium]